MCPRSALALILGAVLTVAGGGAGPNKAWALEAEILDFQDLDGWEGEDFGAAFAVFTSTCPDLKAEEWRAVCAFATTNPEPRAFFELFFRPVRLSGRTPVLFTGYYEPELRAARKPGGAYRYPVYQIPPDLAVANGTEAPPGPTRAEIDTEGALDDLGLEIAWLRDPIDIYFLQIQGSGRLRMRDGRVIRLGYAGQNGHPRRSIAAEMVRREIYAPHQVSAAVIRNWARRNQEEGRELLNHDPSYVFFRVLDDMPEGSGPLGAMNRPLTAGRSVAIDPAIYPLGAPIWIETEGEAPKRRLMIAQDTGGAIRGSHRADLFLGTGPDAGARAGRIRDRGRMVVLLPIDQAYALALGY